jgi:hypothetical protein
VSLDLHASPHANTEPLSQIEPATKPPLPTPNSTGCGTAGVTTDPYTSAGFSLDHPLASPQARDYVLHERQGVLIVPFAQPYEPIRTITPSALQLPLAPTTPPNTGTASASTPGPDFGVSPTATPAVIDGVAVDPSGTKPKRGRPRLTDRGAARSSLSPSTPPPRYHPYSTPSPAQPEATQMSGYLVPHADAAGGVFLALTPVRRAPERKVSMACHYCRKRKIACGAPASESEDHTCK